MELKQTQHQIGARISSPKFGDYVITSRKEPPPRRCKKYEHDSAAVEQGRGTSLNVK